MTASVTISAPYCDQRSVPASIPSSVACMQNPARPTDSSPTESGRSSVKTYGAHSGEVPAMTVPAASPTPTATQIGRVLAGAPPERAVPAPRTSLVASWSSPLAAPATNPKAPQNTPKTAKPAGSSLRAARYSTA
jgi:hypothetical protein